MYSMYYNNKDDNDNITLTEFFKLVEHASEDYDVTINDVDTILDILLCDEVVVLYNNYQVINALQFYQSVFTMIKRVDSFETLCDAIKYMYKEKTKTNTNIDKCRYYVVIYMMQMITHLIWKYLYKYSPKLNSTPIKAISSNDEYAAMMRIELGLLIEDL